MNKLPPSLVFLPMALIFLGIAIVFFVIGYLLGGNTILQTASITIAIVALVIGGIIARWGRKWKKIYKEQKNF